jgi:hypothetical protein
MPQAALTQNPYGLRVRQFPCSVGGTGRQARNMVVESGTPDPTYCKPLGLYCTYEFVFGETQKPYLLHDEFVKSWQEIGYHCQNWQYQEIPLPKLAVPCGYCWTITSKNPLFLVPLKSSW